MIGDTQEGAKYISRTKKRIRKEGAKRSRMVHPGDFLLTNSMSFGRPYIMQTSGCIHDGWLVLSPRDNRIHTDYLFYLLSSNWMYAEFEKRASGATVKNLNIEAVKRIEILLPTLPEQRRIAEVLDKAEYLRTKRLESIQELEAFPQELFYEMFGDPIKNARGFPVRHLKDLIDPDRPISYGILMPGPEQEEGVKYIRVVDMKAGGIDLSSIRKTTAEISDSYRRSLLKPGDLLMSIRGHVGRFAVVPEELGGANITQDTARLAILGASSVFIRECLRTKAFQHWMARHTKGVAVRGINLGDVKQMPIILPSKIEQEVFAAQINSIEKLIRSHRSSLSHLEALFASLQHRAFRGEL